VLRQLTVEATSVPAAVAAIAADDRPLAESRRILLVYATDALNSGMTFTSPARETLVTLGKTPVLLRAGRLEATLRTPHAAALKLWALGLDGRRAQALPIAAEGQSLTIRIDTSRIEAITPFFELAAE
jgi:hypothetical protein